MTTKLLVLGAFFLATSGYVASAMQPEQVPLRESLAGLPQQIDGWSGRDGAPLTPAVLAVLGVDEYLSRIYQAASGKMVGLYIGYYQSQREGDTIHSPMNCLPGAGWQPIEVARTEIAIPGRSTPITVNDVIIQKGIERQAVLYWYQSHGRVVASEYWSKIFMVTDAVRSNRSDAALLRVVSPVLPSDGRVGDARERARRFVEALFPRLERYLPS